VPGQPPAWLVVQQRSCHPFREHARGSGAA